MSRWWWLLLAIPLLGALGYWLVTAKTHLKAGDSAPEFSLIGSDGQTHNLSNLRGRVVVLAWYPPAFTPAARANASHSPRVASNSMT